MNLVHDLNYPDISVWETWNPGIEGSFSFCFSLDELNNSLFKTFKENRRFVANPQKLSDYDTPLRSDLHRGVYHYLKSIGVK